MSEEKQFRATDNGLVYKDNIIFADTWSSKMRGGGIKITEGKKNAYEIVRMGNSYEQDQKTIDALVDACKTYDALVDACKALLEDFDPDSEYYQKIYVQGMNALALAEKG